MTEKLYDEQPYETEFEAKVISWDVAEDEKGVYKTAVLDRTLFFPNQGGQTSDIGTLGNYIVEKVTIEMGVITHYLREEIKPDIYRLRDYDFGDNILGSVDWKHRFSNMQQHTGEHIFTGLAHNKYGCENVGFHLSDNVVTLDLDKPLTDEEIEAVEVTANAVITANVPVRAFYPAENELDIFDYRCKDGIEGDVRLVEIAGVDLCACCAPHVRSTGEVGFLKVIRHEKYKGGVRIWILCGNRALYQWQQDMRVIESLVKELTCQPTDILAIVKDLKEKNKNIAYELSCLKQDKIMISVSHMAKAPGKLISIFESGLDSKCMREVVNSCVSIYNSPTLIASGEDENGYDFVASVPNGDSRDIINAMRAYGDVKGGGTAAQIQGHVMLSRDAIEKAISTLY